MQVTEKIQKLFVASLFPVAFFLQAAKTGFLQTPLTVTAFACCAVFIVVFVSLTSLIIKERKKVSLTRVDLLLGGCFTYRFIYGFAGSGNDYFSSRLIGELAICFVYLLIRIKKDFNGPVIWSCLLVGFAESVLALLQAMHLARGNNEFFNITGTFGNPGQLGGFIAVQLFLVGYQIGFCRKRFPRGAMIFLYLLALLLGAVLLLSQSRASWLAVFVAGFYMLILKIRNTKFNLRPLVNRSSRILAACLIVVLFVLLYHYKKDSADGRLLIWRVTLEMIAGHPVSGSGPGTFPAQYFAYQADYFVQNPDSRFLLLADNPSYAFNEYLQVTAELGIVDLAILLLVIIAVFKAKGQSAEDIFLKASFLSYCFFAFFSYPSGVFMLSAVSAVLLALLSSPVVFRFTFPRKLQGMLLLLCIPLFIYFLRCNQLLRKTNAQMNALYSGDAMRKANAQRFIASNYPALKNEKVFLFPYALYFSNSLNCEERLRVLEDAAQRIPSVDILCELGKQYQELRRYKDAESCFMETSHAVPARILPNYNLFQLYRQQGDTLAAEKMAKKILQQPLKVENTITVKVKAAARVFLEKLK